MLRGFVHSQDDVMNAPEPSRNEIRDPQQVANDADLSALRHPKVPAKPLSLTLCGNYISVTVTGAPSATPAIDQVLFHALNSSGTPVMAFQTKGRIHPRLYIPILRVIETGDDFCDIEKVLKKGAPLNFEAAIAAAIVNPTASKIEAIARNLYTLLSNHSAIEWQSTPLQSLAPSSISNLELNPVPPTLEQFISSPSIIEEQFAAKRVTSEEVINLQVTLNPGAGYLIATTRVVSLDDDEINTQRLKITAATPLATYDSMKKELLEEARTLWASLQSGGVDGITDFMERRPRNSIQMPTSQEERRQLDERLAKGLSDIEPHLFTASTQQLTSGASLELMFGQQYATICCRPDGAVREHYTSLTFNCSRSHPQLTAAQIDEIQTIYDLLSSESTELRAKGLAKCIDLAHRSDPALIIENYNRGQSISTGSSNQLVVQINSAQPLIQDFFRAGGAERLFSIPGISLVAAGSDGIDTIRTLLDGGKPLSVHLNSARAFPSRPELFHSVQFALMNGGDVRVRLTNYLGSIHTTVMPYANQIEFPSSTDMVVWLCELFALQPAQSWVPLVEEIDRLSGEDTRDATLWPWEPSRTGLPPTSDTVAAKMLEHAAEIYSNIATGYSTTFPRGTVWYGGEGAIELSLTRDPSALNLRFRLEHGYLRELTLYITERIFEDSAGTDVTIARFHSNELKINSDIAQALFDACAAALHEIPEVVELGWFQRHGKSITDPLITLASAHMTRLT